MLKKILYILLYFGMVFGGIFGWANLVGMSENEVLAVLSGAAVVLVLYCVIRKILKKPRWKKKKISGAKRRRRYLRTSTAVVVAGVLLLVFAAGGYIWRIQAESIPDSLIEFGEKYPEALSFVRDYLKKKDRHPEIDIDTEVQKGTIPLFLQWDERWGYEQYGSDFFAITGCGPTCLSMVYAGLTGSVDMNPLEMARFSEQSGYYVPGEGTSWKLMTSGAEALGLRASEHEPEAAFIWECLERDVPLICSMLPGDFTYTGHFIVLTGLDMDRNVVLNDPNSRKNSDRRWSMEELLPQIRRVWAYEF